MTSDPPAGTRSAREAYAWVWLPSAVEPVVAGLLERVGDVITFTYGRSYLAREDAVSLYEPELPLRPGRIEPLPGLSIASCLRDAGPDAWGQRVVLARRSGHLTAESDTGDLDRLTYLLESGSDRIGALDFQTSPADYVARTESAPPWRRCRERRPPWRRVARRPNRWPPLCCALRRWAARDPRCWCATASGT